MMRNASVSRKQFLGEQVYHYPGVEFESIHGIDLFDDVIVETIPEIGYGIPSSSTG